MAPMLSFVVLALVATGASALNPLPGATNSMSRGFDMITGVQNYSAGPGLLPIFTWTYENGNTWTSPVPPYIIYDVPDQLTVNNLELSETEINAALSADMSAWLSLVSHSFNIGLGINFKLYGQSLGLNFKFSHESGVYNQMLKGGEYDAGFSRHYLALYSLEGIPPAFMPLADEFKAGVSMLPTAIKSAADQLKYNQMIEYFGTHFAMAANFGGRVHMSSFLEKSVLESHSMSWADSQFSLAFHYWLFDISAGGFHNRSEIHMSAEFKEASKTFIFFEGGSLALQSNTTLLPWIESIPYDPVHLNVTLSDLSLVVEPISSVKAANLRNVIKSYLSTGKLPATDGSIQDYDAFYAKYAKMELEELENKHQDRIQTSPALRSQ